MPVSRRNHKNRCSRCGCLGLLDWLPGPQMTSTTMQIGKRISLISILVSGSLAIAKIVVGWLAGSTAVVADGVESASDVVASSFVLVGFILAARPADENHPYGYGRYETLAGLLVAAILFAAGVGICYRSLRGIGEMHAPPEAYAFIPLAISMAAKAALSYTKFRYGKRIRSVGLIANAWNDFVDIISAITAMAALALTLVNPTRFLAADHWGGFAVGLIVIFTAIRVGKDASARLTDAMPEADWIEPIRRVALSVPGAAGVEKLFARNTGLQYHVDLHLEVDPEKSVRDAHEVANEVRFKIRRQLPWVADVLVHVEPSPNGRESPSPTEVRRSARP